MDNPAPPLGQRRPVEKMGKIKAMEQGSRVGVRKEKCHLRALARGEEAPRMHLLWSAESALEWFLEAGQRWRAAVRLVGDGGRDLMDPEGRVG